MNAEVHMPVGVASATGLALSLPIMQCKSVVDYTSCIGCAIIGALLVDIDANGDSKAKKEFRKVLAVSVIAAIVVLIQEYMGGHMMQAVSTFIYTRRGLGVISFVALCIVGYRTAHRHFTHWAITCCLFTFTFYLITDMKLALWFGVGYLSHQLIDLINKMNIRWLYPLPFEFSLGLCKAKSRLSTVIGIIATGLSYYFIYLLVTKH